MAKSKFTATDFIANHTKPSGYTAGEIVEFIGWSASGDGGAAQWKATGNVITPSQSPADLGDARLSDASGNEFELVTTNSLVVTQLGFDASQDNSSIWAAIKNSTSTIVQSSNYNTSFYVVVPAGEYKIPAYTTFTAYDDGVFVVGEGRLVTTDSSTERYRSNNSIFISEPSNSVPAGSSVIADFDADFRSVYNYQSIIEGDDTAGAVSHGGGYLSPNTTVPFYHRSRFASGGNANAYDAADRTGWAAHRVSVEHRGKGDVNCINANIGLFERDPNVIGFLGQPAGGLLNGQVTAYDDLVVINPCEINMNDGGFDVTTKALVLNIFRTNDDADEDQVCTGIRMQSSGTVAADGCYQILGKWKVGLDLSTTTVADTPMAIALRKGHKIHWDTESNERKPAPQWITSDVISATTYRYNEGKIYESTSTGTTGATPPNHTSGTVSDGGVDWLYIKAASFKGWAATDSGTTTGLDENGNIVNSVLGNERTSLGVNSFTVIDNNGRSGATASTAARDIVIDSGEATFGVSFIGVASSVQYSAAFGDTDNSLRGWTRYDHSNDTYNIGVSGSNRVKISNLLCDLTNINLAIGGTKVLGPQHPAISDSVGGDESAKINEILAALRAHGIIAT